MHKLSARVLRETRVYHAEIDFVIFRVAERRKTEAQREMLGRRAEAGVRLGFDGAVWKRFLSVRLMRKDFRKVRSFRVNGLRLYLR